MKKTVLIIPPNDPEALMIYEIAKGLGIQIIRSPQPHGADLDKELDIVPLVKAGGWERVVIVEMPGLKTEAKLRKLGVEVVIIDHHHYTGIERAHDKKGKSLPSSLEQFLKLFRVTDAKLAKLGYDPRIVLGIGVMDRGFVWAMQKDGFNEKEIAATIALQRTLLGSHGMLKDEDRKMAVARKAWDGRTQWDGYQIVQHNTDVEIRSRVSMIVALEVKKPTPIIFVEKKRGLIYVQESKNAMDLFRTFGGFTFGVDHNWGFRNVPGKKTVSLKDVQVCLTKFQ